jgi:diguanylate cyclase (GGDEF)-like protein
MIPSNGTVLLNLSAQRYYLAEYLAHSRHRVQVLDWTGVQEVPSVIVTDASWTDSLDGDLADGIRHGQIGVIGLGIQDQVDVSLPSDVQGREVATAIELVGQIVALRRQRDHNQEECRRWIDLAHVDPLTGLPNRRAWQAELDQRCIQNHSLCVGLIDVDFFKQINDRNGHHVGDAVLREVAIAMMSHLRENDFVARLGGDEFGIMLSDVTAEDAEKIIQRVRTYVVRHLASRCMPSNTLSAGYVAVPSTDEHDSEELYSWAARSLRQAKQQSRDCAVAGAP